MTEADMDDTPPPSRIPVARPYLWGDEIRLVQRAIARRSLSGRSPEIHEFEEVFADWIGLPHASAVSSGTAALHLALLAVGVNPGDEVIVPDFVMGSPLFAVRYCGAIPVAVDADDSWNIDPDAITAKVGPATRAIVAVHTYGHPANMAAIVEVAGRHGLPVVEDAAEAMGATVQGRAAGTLGDVGCFSLYANKTITAGEGGVVVTRDPSKSALVRALRDMHFGDTEAVRFTHQRLGYNYRLSGLQAAFASAQVPYIDDAVARKNHIADVYRKELEGVTGLVMPPRRPWATSSAWVFPVVLDPRLGLHRDWVQRRLGDEGIETRRFFEVAHRQPFLPGLGVDEDFPRACWLADHGFYLPSYIELGDPEIRKIAASVRRVMRLE